MREATITERPILFSAHMVRAILEGRKTQTRRIVSPQPKIIHALYEDASLETERIFHHGDQRIHCPFGRPGDRLWVRETHYRYGLWTKNGKTKAGRQAYTFSTDDNRVRWAEEVELPRPAKRFTVGWWKRPGIFLPHKLARLFIEITEVRVQRLNAITAADAAAEGVDKVGEFPNITPWRNYLVQQPAGARNFSTPQASFMSLWDSINGKRENCDWKSNPWVWAVSFRRVEGK